MAKQSKKITAVDIRRPTTVAGLAGGSRDVERGDVLIVGQELSSEDALFLVSAKKAEPCEPALKEKRAKEKAKEQS